MAKVAGDIDLDALHRDGWEVTGLRMTGKVDEMNESPSSLVHHGDLDKRMSIGFQEAAFRQQAVYDIGQQTSVPWGTVKIIEAANVPGNDSQTALAATFDPEPRFVGFNLIDVNFLRGAEDGGWNQRQLGFFTGFVLEVVTT